MGLFRLLIILGGAIAGVAAVWAIAVFAFPHADIDSAMNFVWLGLIGGSLGAFYLTRQG